MKQRATEIVFRQLLFILLPFFIIVPLTTAVALRPKPPMWRSAAVIWVDQYALLYEDDRLGYSPAMNQAQLLNSLLQTRTFSLGVLQQTRLAPQLTSSYAEDEALSLLSRSVGAFPTSNSFVSIAAVTGDPDLSQELVTVLVTSFQEALRARIENQSQLTSTLYSDGLKKAEDALAKSRRELSNYLIAHPELSRTDSTAGLAAARDTTLPRLQSQVAYDEREYNSLRERVDVNRRYTMQGLEGQQLAFNVIDEAQVPNLPLPVSKLSYLKLPVIGVIVAALLSSGLAAILVLTNRAVLSRYDIQTLGGVPLLGEVPVLRRRKRLWQRSHRDAVRLKLGMPAHG